MNIKRCLSKRKKYRVVANCNGVTLIDEDKRIITVHKNIAEFLTEFKKNILGLNGEIDNTVSLAIGSKKSAGHTVNYDDVWFRAVYGDKLILDFREIQNGSCSRTTDGVKLFSLMISIDELLRNNNIRQVIERSKKITLSQTV